VNKPIVNVAASVRQKLLNIAREEKEDFGLLLTKYGLERVLYRISQSRYRPIFVLKGALLFELWTRQRYRPTRDADFLARGENDPVRFVEIFKEICSIVVEDDGLEFEHETITAERISEDADYQGVRLKFTGLLAKARIPIQIDLGFGDTITPAAVEANLPTLLDLPAPNLLTYPPETVIAEKFEAAVSLGMANSRMKDLYDIRGLAQRCSFEGRVLSEAIINTFRTRGTELPRQRPVVVSSEFFENADKKKQWAAFTSRNRSHISSLSLESVCNDLSVFLLPIIDALAEKRGAPKKWTSGTWEI
jgi:hypothetical protein